MPLPSRSLSACAVILAGGASRRMGRSKALLPWAGRPLIAHVVEQVRPAVATVSVSANDAELFAFLGVPIIPDQVAGQGPLMALASCLQASTHELMAFIACDMPLVDADLVTQLIKQAEGVDAVVPRGADGQLEPLCAVYRRSCVPAVLALLAHGDRRMTDLLDRVQVREAALPPGPWFRNVNTPDDYQAALKNSGISPA